MLLVLASLLSLGLCAPQTRQLGGCLPEDPMDQKWTDLLVSLKDQNMISLPQSYHIESVCHQTTNGVTYNFNLRIGSQPCHLVYYEQLWTSTRQIKEDTCHLATRVARDMMTTPDPTRQTFVDQNPSLQSWRNMLYHLQDMKLITLPADNDAVTIVSVAKQLVSGYNYRFTLNIEGHTCELVYYYQEWTGTNLISYDTCGIKVTKTRRSGGYQAQDPTDPQYMMLLEKLGNQSLIALNGVESITGVSTQVVAGMNYKFNLMVNGQACQIVYFEQSWTNTHTITKDTCGIKVTKRQIMGGYNKQDEKDPQYMLLLQDLAARGLVTLPQNGGLTLNSVYEQVVAGFNYRFNLTINGNVCELDYFEQSWTNTHRITYDTCNIKVTKRRAGGYASQDPKDPQYQLLLQGLGAQGLIVMPQNGQVYNITGVSTQVVAGLNYKFELLVNGQACQIVYFEQSWTNTHTITKDTCGIKVTKRQIPGGYNKQDEKDPQYMLLLQDLAARGLVTLPQNGGLTLNSVYEQVVAGFNYKFNLTINGNVCELDYFEQSWTNTHRITYDTCNIKVTKRLAGGYAPQDPKDPQYQLLLQDLGAQGLIVMPQNGQVYNITGVSTQVVAGLNYKFELVVNGQSCQLVYFEQSWTNTHTITNDTCGIKVTKRQIAGGYNKQDEKDPQYMLLLQDLASRGLVTLPQNGGYTLNSVYMQVVAGFNYKFNLTINGHTCELDYFERSWTNTHEIKYDTCNIKVTKRRLGGACEPKNPKDPQYQLLLQDLGARGLITMPQNGAGYTMTGVCTQVVAGLNYKFELLVNGQTCQLVYFEQSWTNTHTITNDTCGIKVTKRQIPGGYNKQDEKDPQYMLLLQDLAARGLVTLPQNGGLTINSVYEQVVAGFNYKFNLTINGVPCEFVYFEQSWTNTHEIKDDTCNIKVTKRQLAGGNTPQDPNNVKYQLLLQDLAARGLIATPPNGEDYTITGVSTQVVAGINYKFELLVNGVPCELVYFEQSWTNTHEIKDDTCNIKVTKRQLAGGNTPQDPNNVKYQLLLQDLAARGLIATPPNGEDYTITGVSTQVVAGINYKFELLVNGVPCELVYFEQSWTNTHEIKDDTCNIKVTKRQLAGGNTPQDPNNVKYQLLLQDLAARGLIATPPNGEDYTITGVSTQVVAGINYKFELLVNGVPCELVYFEQSWTNTHEIKDDTCNIKVTKRQLAGGNTPQDPNNVKYQLLLQDLAARGLIATPPNGEDYTITGVSTQVVAGINYKFELLVNGVPCELVYFEQSWTNTHEIKDDTCNIKVTKRQLAGGNTPQDPNNVKYQLLLQDLAARGLIATPPNGEDYTITGVSTQVVAGINYKFELLVNGVPCELVYFEQSWTNTHEIKDDTCNIKVTKRQLAGGNTPQEPNNVKYQLLLQDLAARGLIATPPNGEDYNITGVSTQVVAGVIYTFQLNVGGKACQLVYFEQSWTNTHTVSEDSCNIAVKQARRANTFTPLSDTNSASVQECIGMGLDRVNAMSNSLFRLVEDTITSAQQKSHGSSTMEYKLAFTTLPSTCFNNDGSAGLTSSGCPVDQSHTFQSNTWSVTCMHHAGNSPSTQVTDVTMM